MLLVDVVRLSLLFLVANETCFGKVVTRQHSNVRYVPFSCFALFGPASSTNVTSYWQSFENIIKSHRKCRVLDILYHAIFFFFLHENSL